MIDLMGGSPHAALLMVLAALVVGYSKTALNGVAAIAVAIFAFLLPAKESTAAILAVLIVGDLVAVWHFRHDADWRLIRRLLPAVLPGLALGTVFLNAVSDSVLRRTIGIVLLVLVALQLWVKSRASGSTNAMHERRSAAWAAGTGMGFATMTANAAGPVMTLFLSTSGVDKLRFVGTSAWFFLIVNVVKVPFSAGLGLLRVDDVGRALQLAPFVVVGGLLGYATVQRISQRGFDVAALLASALAAAALLL